MILRGSAPARWVVDGVEIHIRSIKSDKEHVRLRKGTFQFYEFGHESMSVQRSFTNDELGIARTREIHVLASGERGHAKFCLLTLTSWPKSVAWEQNKRVSPGWSHR